MFELGSCHYDTYLLNIRLPAKGNLNRNIGLVTGLTFVVRSINFNVFSKACMESHKKN